MSMDTVQDVALTFNPVTGPVYLGKKLIYDPIEQNRENSERARKAQEKLEAQRRAQLAAEGADREAARKRAETAGQRVGASTRDAFLGAAGAGSGNTPFGPGTGFLFGN